MAVRSGRERKLSEKFRNVDTATLATAAAQQLNALENDNHAIEVESQLRSGDNDYMPLRSGTDDDDDMAAFTKSASSKRRKTSTASTRGRKNGRSTREKPVKAGSLSAVGKSGASRGGSNIERWNMSLANMLQKENPAERPANMVHYDAITAQPSQRPTRRFCIVCGYDAAYTCRQCSSRFCSVSCNVIHQQAQCLKFIT